MLELKDALARILAAMPAAEAEAVELRDAYRRFLLEPVSAGTDVPPFDNAAVDGYAVRAADLGRASAEQPAELKLAGRVPAGKCFDGELSAGFCIRLFTGSPIPKGADAVVMQEQTRVTSENPSVVSVLGRVEPWENVRFRGEDFKAGVSLVQSGQPLTVGRIALVAASGIARVTVGRRPRVALLATGSELRSPGEALAPGQIYESNRLALAPLIENVGGRVAVFPIVPDTAADTSTALERALGESDVVITCGGVSVGELDFVKTAFEQQGGSLEFWKVAIRPGRPFVFGRRGRVFLFGLPGNPVSALVTFLLLARPALLRWQGARPESLSMPVCTGVLAESLDNPGSRRQFIRVTIDADGSVRPAGVQASHILSSFAAANGLLELAPKAALVAGATVRVLRSD